MNHKLLRSFCICGFITFIGFSANAQYAKEVPAWNRPVEPFKIIGNIYYVGASDITSFLIVTPAGDILLDGGFDETAIQIESNVKKLGFNLKDVRYLLNSHAHCDHAGGLARLKSATGAKLCASRQDAVQLESGGKDDYALGDTMLFRPVNVDRLLNDGDTVELGGTVLTAHLTPGHTKGDTTWTMKVTEGGKQYDVVFFGSTSILPGVKLIGNPKYPNIAHDYARSFRVLKSLHCDVFLGAHGRFFDLSGKIRKMKNGAAQNPFIDPDGYVQFVDQSEKTYLDQLKKERASSGGV